MKKINSRILIQSKEVAERRCPGKRLSDQSSAGHAVDYSGRRRPDRRHHRLPDDPFHRAAHQPDDRRHGPVGRK